MIEVESTLCRTKNRSKTPEYSAWQQMKDRCTNPNSQRWDRYGGRGIRVCERWMNSFENFYADVGPRPREDGPFRARYSLGRINNNGNYEPGNVRWENKHQQENNKCTNVFLEHDGKRMTIADWSKETGLNQKTIALRLKAGWSLSDTLSTPAEARVWDGAHSHKSQRILRRAAKDLAAVCVMNETCVRTAKALLQEGNDLNRSVGQVVELLSQMEHRAEEAIRKAEGDTGDKWLNMYVTQQINRQRKAENVTEAIRRENAAAAKER